MAKPDKTLSNREHHLTYFQEGYKEKQIEFAKLVLIAEKFLTDLNELHRVSKNMDSNRRENAVHMGVPISESDKHYSLDGVIAGVPALVREIKEQYKKLGLEIGETP